MHHYLAPTKVAEMLEISPKTLANWRSLRVGPQPTRLGSGRILYRAADVEAWLDERHADSRDWMAG